MRRLHSLFIEWDGPWFDRLEPVSSITLRTRATKPKKRWIKGCSSLVHGMVIAAMCVCLPDLYHSIRDGYSITVEYTPLNANMLTDSLRLGQHIAASILT